mgnify:CR=1 FL=1
MFSPIFSVDATHSEGMGKMINDSHLKPNSKVMVEKKEGKPVLAIYSIHNIKAGEEILYDYKDTTAFWRRVSDSFLAFLTFPV